MEHSVEIIRRLCIYDFETENDIDKISPCFGIDLQ